MHRPAAARRRLGGGSGCRTCWRRGSRKKWRAPSRGNVAVLPRGVGEVWHRPGGPDVFGDRCRAGTTSALTVISSPPGYLDSRLRVRGSRLSRAPRRAAGRTFPAQWYDARLVGPWGRRGCGDRSLARAVRPERFSWARLSAIACRRPYDRAVDAERRRRCRRRFPVDGALASILPELDGRVWPTRLQMLPSNPHPPRQLPHAISTRGGWDYAQQLPGGAIAFGGCRDAGGTAERTSDATITAPVQAALERRFAEVMGARRP